MNIQVRSRSGVQVRFLQPEEYPMADEFFSREGIPRLDPNWSKIVAAIDLATGKVEGVMCLQVVAHAEPIWLSPDYRGDGIWRGMAETMDGYLTEMARQGALAGVYSQPTHPEAEHLCQAMGMRLSGHPLYVKNYLEEDETAYHYAGHL